MVVVQPQCSAHARSRAHARARRVLCHGAEAPLAAAHALQHVRVVLQQLHAVAHRHVAGHVLAAGENGQGMEQAS